jgi:hypothetical protein
MSVSGPLTLSAIERLTAIARMKKNDLRAKSLSFRGDNA